MKKRYINIFVLTIFILLNAIILKGINTKQNNLENYFRLHIVANSNSIKDQSIKKIVAKDVYKQINEILGNNKHSSKLEVKEAIINNVNDILLASNVSLKKQNTDKTAIIKIGNIYYDKKQKEDIYMTAGVYDSMQVIIGEGKGNNFWSLIYPYSYAGIYELDEITDSTDNYTGFIENINNTNNDILTTKDFISSDNVKYKSRILELAKKMWFN